MSDTKKIDEGFEQFYNKLVDNIVADQKLEEKEMDDMKKRRDSIVKSMQHLNRITFCNAQIRMSAGLENTTMSKIPSHVFLKGIIADFTEMLSNYLDSLDNLDDAAEILQDNKDKWDEDSFAKLQKLVTEFKKKSVHQFNAAAQGLIDYLSNLKY